MLRAGALSFLDPSAFGAGLICENQKVGSRENNPPVAPAGVFLVLKLIFLPKYWL
jgi:hypothetical protein